VTTAERMPPLDRFTFKPNTYSGNVLVGSGAIAEAASAGFTTQPLPAGWSEAAELLAVKPLTAEDVGPAWIVALRGAGRLAGEDVTAAGSAAMPEPKKKKRTAR
jgi:hypothetical protein